VSFDSPWDPKILPNIPDEAVDDEEEYEEDEGDEEPEFGFI
jgi:hypothetical protein